MMKVYYKSKSRVATAAAFLLYSLSASNALLAGQGTVLKAAAVESHEGLTISARPWTSEDLYKEKFGKNSPFRAGIVAIHLSFRNDSNQAIKVDLERIQLQIQLSDNNRQNLGTLTPEDVADSVRNPGSRDVATRRKPLPLPGKRTGGRDKHWDELVQIVQDAGLPSRLVGPHSTMQGLVFFDVRGQLDLLDTAHLYIPDLVALETNHPLFYFEIDLGRHAAN
jgi:hypothetical protein